MAAESTKEDMQHDHKQHMLLMIFVLAVGNLTSRSGQERYLGYAVLVLAPLAYVIMKRRQTV